MFVSSNYVSECFCVASRHFDLNFDSAAIFSLLRGQTEFSFNTEHYFLSSKLINGTRFADAIIHFLVFCLVRNKDS